MDVFTFTYSDGYDIPDIHGWNYYIMDDFLFIIYIYYSWYLEWLCFACIAHQIFIANDIQMAYDRALPWISMANPFRWMTAARCANAAAGISSGCVLARGKMSLASEYRNVLRFVDACFCLDWTWQVSQ